MYALHLFLFFTFHRKQKVLGIILAGGLPSHRGLTPFFCSVFPTPRFEWVHCSFFLVQQPRILRQSGSPRRTSLPGARRGVEWAFGPSPTNLQLKRRAHTVQLEVSGSGGASEVRKPRPRSDSAVPPLAARRLIMPPPPPSSMGEEGVA